MKSAKSVTELVLVPKILIPIGMKEKVIGLFARPPRFLEITVKRSVSSDKGRRNSGTSQVHFLSCVTAVDRIVRHGRNVDGIDGLAYAEPFRCNRGRRIRHSLRRRRGHGRCLKNAKKKKSR